MQPSDPHDPPDSGAWRPAATPLGLDYFAPGAPGQETSGAGNLALGAVVLSLLPFVCGVVNVAVAANSYSPTVTGSHRGGATLFLAAGVILCGLGLARLVTLRRWTGVLFAGVVLAAQVVVVACTGAVAVW